MIALWWGVMRKIIRISKQNRITSLADFIASRYGQERAARRSGYRHRGGRHRSLHFLQLKAVSNSFTIVLQYPAIVMPAKTGTVPFLHDTALGVALILAAFAIAFGTRHLDAAEHHQGMVAAIAFESLVKLLAFLAVGTFVTFGIYNGFGDVFERATASTDCGAMLTPLEGVAGSYASWAWLTILSMLAIHVPAPPVSGRGDRERRREAPEQAIWLFPLYMLAINVFVLRLHSADCCGSQRQRRCGRVRADAADGGKTGTAGSAGVHRRTVGRNRHGDR